MPRLRSARRADAASRPEPPLRTALTLRESHYLKAIQTSLHGAGLPYGYAITVWSTGAALVAAHGPPSLVEIYLFASGAVAAYGGLTFLTWGTEGEAKQPLTRSPRRVRAGLLHVGAIALAITFAALVARLTGGVAWLIAPLVATLVYLAVSSVEVALMERERHMAASSARAEGRRGLRGS